MPASLVALLWSTPVRDSGPKRYQAKPTILPATRMAAVFAEWWAGGVISGSLESSRESSRCLDAGGADREIQRDNCGTVLLILGHDVQGYSCQATGVLSRSPTRSLRGAGPTTGEVVGVAGQGHPLEESPGVHGSLAFQRPSSRTSPLRIRREHRSTPG